jgi:CTP synthase
VRICLIGKYTVLSDAYLSVLKSLQHACMAAGLKLQLDWVEAQHLEEEAKAETPEKYEASWALVRRGGGSWGGLEGGRGAGGGG